MSFRISAGIFLAVIVITMGVTPAFAAYQWTIHDDCGVKPVTLTFEKNTLGNLVAHPSVPTIVYECGGIFSKPHMNLTSITLKMTEPSQNVCVHTLVNNQDNNLGYCPLAESGDGLKFTMTIQYDGTWEWKKYHKHGWLNIQ